MSLLFASDNFKTYLKEPAGDKKYLAYIDFRQQLYPPLTGHGLTFHTLKELFDRGGCDSPDPPLMLGETTAQAAIDCTWARSSVQHYKGNYSWVMTKTSAAGAGAASVFLVDGVGIADMHGLEAGKKYTLKHKGRTDLGATWPYCRIYEYYGAAWHTTDIGTMSSTDTWESHSDSFELTSATAGIQIRFIIPTNAAIGSVYYIDEIWLQEENITGSHIADFRDAVNPIPQYCLDLPSYFTFWIRTKPYFAYDIGSNQYFIEWYYDSNHYFYVYYDQSWDKILIAWKDGVVERYMNSQQFDDGSSHTDINQWIDIVGVIDLRTSSSADSELWIDWTKIDSNWNGVKDAKATNFPLMGIGTTNNSASTDVEIAFLRIWPDVLITDTAINAYFKTVKEEEIYFPFNGHGVGHTRCNISNRVHNLDIVMSKESRVGFKIANTGSMTIDNALGIFSDDQYASFDAGLEQYNGLVTDKFMQQRCGVELEIFYETGKVYEPLFTGRLNENGFSRSSTPGDKSRVTAGFSDLVSSIENASLDKSVYYEDYTFCNPTTETESLIHLITRLASQQKIYNYASNSSFENADPTDSWKTMLLDSWTREAGGLFGSNQGDMVYDAVGGGTQYIYQEIQFIGDKSLNVGEIYTFSIYLKSADACGQFILISERDAGGQNDSSVLAYSLTGGEGWVKFSVTHTITDADSDRLWIRINMDDNVTLSVDGAMLVQNDEAWNFFVLNADDGTAGVYDADDAFTNDRYDTYEQCGFDTIASALVHPWALIPNDMPVWIHIENLADAILARSMGFDWAGTFRYRSRYEEEEKDPNAIEDIGGFDVQEIGSNVTRVKYNRVIVRGVKYKKVTEDRLLWTVDGSNDVGWVKAHLVELADNADWPDAATYGIYFAKFKVYTQAPGFYKEPYAIPQGNIEVVGAKSIRKVIIDLGGNLTEDLFDTSRADGVYIGYTNNTGDTVWLVGYGIFGQPIFRIGGNIGYIHDYFKDVIDIRKNGEIPFRLENNFIMDKTQIDKLAEYHWNRRDTMHTYTKVFLGCWLFLLPGEWINAELGTVGTSEYLDYKAEIREISWSYDNRGRENTTIIFDETAENWKKQSTACTRFEEYGHPYKDECGRANHVLVASSETVQMADYYCDGTSDEDEINSAIDFLEGLGGGTIELTEGTFYIDGAVILKDNIQIIGQGNQTKIEKNANDNAFRGDGASGTELTGIRLSNFKIQRNAADTNANVYYINFDYVDNSIIENLFLNDAYDTAIYLINCDDNKIMNCIVNGNQNNDGILITGNGNLIENNHLLACDTAGIDIASGTGNVIRGNYCNGNRDGIDNGGDQSVISGNVCISNTVDGIILIQTDNASITGNQCNSNTNDGIRLVTSSDNNLISGNICTGNDQGINIDGGGVDCDRNVVTGNRATGNTTAQFTNNGTNTTDSGNDWN